MPIMELFFYGFTLWLGAYLLARDSQKTAVSLTGWGLIAYALALAIQILFHQFIPVILLVPPLFWLGAALHLLPEEYKARPVLIRIWMVSSIPLAIQILVHQFIPVILLVPPLFWLGAALHLLPEEYKARPVLIRIWMVSSIPLAILTLVNPWFAALIIVALMVCAGMIAKLALGSPRSRFGNTFALLAVIALFVTLSVGLLILPLHWIPIPWGMALLGFDLIFLGLTITAWDAFEEGESMRAHLVRSFISALYYAGALTLIVSLFSGNAALLLGLITFGILTQTFSNTIQSVLDKLTLPQKTTEERQALRQTADELPRFTGLEPAEMSEEQFIRLTRRALSHLGDLPKLAASPLVDLPIVEGTNPLERAQALKALLVQSIQKLKPPSKTGFGVTDEWRYYNALHFPYVLGLKPYTRRADYASLDETSRAALDWFQTSVPERTLHNWQNAAAKLIAEDLRSQRLQTLVVMATSGDVDST